MHSPQRQSHRDCARDGRVFRATVVNVLKTQSEQEEAPVSTTSTPGGQTQRYIALTHRPPWTN